MDGVTWSFLALIVFFLLFGVVALPLIEIRRSKSVPQLPNSDVGVRSATGEDETATQSSGDGKLRFVLALLGAAVLSGLVGCPGMGPKANAKFQASVARRSRWGCRL